MPQNQNEQTLSAPPAHLLTPANVLTLARPAMAFDAARRLVAGEGGAVPMMVAMAATDAEGKVARAIDKHFPGSGYGGSELGMAADPIADTAAFLEVAVGALRAPKVSKLGKAAVGTVLATEAVKTAWAAKANIKYRKETGNQLVISPSFTGKSATAAKFGALTAAASTGELSGKRRGQAGIAALGMAVTGGVLGEKARRSYARDLQQKS